MLPVVWEVAIPIAVAFVVGWVVMGWLTWRWRRSGASRADWSRLEVRASAAEAERDEAHSERVRLREHLVAVERDRNRLEDLVDQHRPSIGDLTLIRGVGPKMASALKEQGFVDLARVASMTADEVDRVAASLGAFPDRIRRDRWVDQARDLVATIERDDAPAAAAVRPEAA